VTVDGPDAPPEQIHELAETCREYVQRAVGVELDYTTDTLSVLDHYAKVSREGLTERPELAELVGRAMGAYFGEVVRRMLPSFWRLPSADAAYWEVCGVSVFLAFNPLGVAWDALYGCTEHGGPSSEIVLDPAERDAVEKRLAELPEVSEDEYWLFTTRLEVIEVTAEALRLAMLEGGTSGVTFDADDYRVRDQPIGNA
jgi:hypothetical protein